MAEQSFEPDELRVEGFSLEHGESVSKLLLKFMVHQQENGNEANELGLVFKGSSDYHFIEPIVDSIFDEHPELEEDRLEMDQKWWDNFSDEDKKKYEGDKNLFEERKKVSRFRVVLTSPFSSELHQAEIGHHLENTDAQHRSVVMSRTEALGYLAVWSGASTLYLDDHMQVDAKVVDPDLSIEDQRIVVSKFEPILYDLSLP